MARKMTAIVLLVAMVLAVFSIAVGAAAPAKEPFYGSWTISKILVRLPDAVLSNAKAKTYIGKGLTLSATQATYSKTKLSNPSYEISSFSDADFTTSWGLAASKLGLPKNITMVEIYSGKGMNAEMWPAVGTLFVKNATTLVMHLDGVFFELKKK